MKREKVKGETARIREKKTSSILFLLVFDVDDLAGTGGGIRNVQLCKSDEGKRGVHTFIVLVMC